LNISDQHRSKEFEHEPQENSSIDHTSAFRYRDLLESISDVVVVLDKELRYKFVNRAFVEAFTLPKTMVLNKTPTEIFPGIEESDWYKAAKTVLTESKALFVSTELVLTDGQRKCYRSRIYPVPTGILSISADITERIRAEEEIHRQSNLIRSTLNSMTNAVFILDVKPNSHTPVIVDCNTAALKIFGYDKNEIIGKPSDFLHVSNEAFLEFQRLCYSAVEKDQLPFNLAEFHMKRKNGTVLTTEHTVDRLLNDKGELTGWVSIVRDISERKRAENALRESEERYHSLFQTMLEGFAYCKMIFDENGRPVDFVYLDVNSAFGRLTGLRDVVGKRVTEVIPRIKEENPELFEIYGRVVLTGHPEQFEIDLKSSLGVILDVSVFSPMDGNFVAVFEDITERKRLEEELREHAEQLEELVAERTAKLEESEERYRLAKEQLEYAVFSNPAVVYVGKPLPDKSDFWATFVSKSVDSLLGFEPDQLTGESGARFWQSRLPAEDVQKFLAEMPLLWRDGRHAFEYRFLHKDGKYRWIREEQRVIRDAEGNVRDVVGYWIDVTERKRLEDELRSAKKQLEYVVTANPAVIYISKPLPDLSDYASTYMSENVSSLLGFESRDFNGNPDFWAGRIHPDDLILFKQKLPGLWKNDRQMFEYRFLCKDEKYRWVREEAILVRDAVGEPQDVIGYMIDFSEQMKLEEALRTSEQNLRKANENLELGIVETTEQIESIAKLREKLRQTPDLSTGLEMVLETIIWEFGMEIGAIFAFDRGKGLANLQAMKARSEDMSLQQAYPLNSGLIEFEANQTKNISTVVAEVDHSVLQTKSVHSIPIIIGNDIYGVLTLGGSKTEKLTDIDLIILDFYTELISQTITERRLTVKPVREKPVQEATAPTSWPTPIQTIELERGRIYITRNNQSFAYETFSKIVLAGSEGLCITREHPSKIRKRLGLEKTPIIWLTGEASPNEHTIGSLQDLSITLGDFLQKAEQPILLLDGFEYLITNNNFESFLKFLQIIRDRVQSHNAIVIAPVLEKAFEPRTLGLIERETTTLEPKAQ